MEEGVGFLDLTTMRTGSVGTQLLNGYLNPATGPTGGGTETTWPGTSLMTQAYFGSQATNSLKPFSSEVSAATPPGAPGPADVYTLISDQGMQILPEAFCYGPTVLEISPNSAVTGGGPGFVYGYGFGPALLNSIPPDLKVTVGGESATITAFYSNAYGLSSPPFLLQGFSYTIPQGTPGSADVSVSTGSGSATVHSGMTYLPAIQQFPLPGAMLAEGIYDSRRDLYYFTDATSVRVFSKAAGAWLNSIPIPAKGSGERLWGISLSPDGSTLAIADTLGGAVDVLSPDNPSAVKAFPVAQPIGLATGDAGIVYIISSGPQVFKLDTGSGQVIGYSHPTYSFPDCGNYCRIELSPLNSSVYFNPGGYTYVIDTTTGAISFAKVLVQGGSDELSLSTDQTLLSATDYIFEPSLYPRAYVALNLREIQNIAYIYGQKLNSDGRLLFQPTTLGIDVMDGRLGTLLTRIALPITLSPNYDALVSDGKDNILVAITGTNGDGVAVIDLGSIPEPPPLPYDWQLALQRQSFTATNPPPISPAPPSSLAARRPAPRLRQTVPHVTTRKLLNCCVVRPSGLPRQ